MNFYSLNEVCVKRNGRQLLGSITTQFEPGKVTVILGPNGAGKSTLIRVMTGILAPTSGQIMLDGAPLNSFTPEARARRIGYLAQNGRVEWPLKVRHLVALGRLPYGRYANGLNEKDLSAITCAMEEADIAAFADRPVDTLSGGEQARVLLARVLAQEADIILADEPLVGLDIAHQIEILLHLKAQAARGRMVVLVLHDLTLAAHVADRIILLDQGVIAGDGHPYEVVTEDRIEQVFGVKVYIETVDQRGAIITPLMSL